MQHDFFNLFVVTPTQILSHLIPNNNMEEPIQEFKGINMFSNFSLITKNLSNKLDI